MAQVVVADLNPLIHGGSVLAQRFNDLKGNLYSGHLGSDVPAYVEEGMTWWEQAGDIWTLKLFDGTDEITLGTVDTDANTFVPAGVSSGNPPGVVVSYAGAAAPTGWLLCDGSAVSRATYSDLFTAISTTFGAGNGSTTFNLPDIRGRTVAGVDNMGGSPASRLTSTVMSPNGNTLGAVGGSQTHTQTNNELFPHTHTYSRVQSSGTGLQEAPGVGSGNTTVATGSSGGGAAATNTQPTIMLNRIIKT